jgi:hypothetical protein
LRRAVYSILVITVVLLAFGIPVHAAPTIATPTITPSVPGSSDQVTVAVNVTEANPGVQSVMIVYTTDNWVSVNRTVSAPYTPQYDDYRAVIPAQPDGTHLSYYVVAVDASGNSAVNNNSGSYYSYTVGSGTGGGGGIGSFNITSTSLWLIAAILGAMMVGMLVVFKRRSGSSKPSKNKP